MLTDEDVADLEAAVSTCEEARGRLESALATAEEEGDPAEEHLEAVGAALEEWRDAQRRFMALVEASEVDDASTAAMLLKMNHGIDATEARRGLPGVPVDGADQNFDMDLTGTRGSVLTTAAMEHVNG
ncbi:MAG: hypothetical protein BRD55_09435 [Bacteroidetes bacterium SW_9_63_38]|nr:MAG: hypothetical protein BRD55_09435 [Bacteroidetes bacterium SW_9_63_38]